MVNWNDPGLEAKLAMVSVQLLYAILGLYSWEYVRSSHVEIALLRRQLQFRWALVSYLIARLSFLIAIVLLATQFSPFHTRVDCQTMNTLIMITTNVAIGCYTTNLMVRTWIIWTNSTPLRLFLVLLSLGHWTLLTLFVASARATTRNGVCMVASVNPAYASAVLIYGLFFDLALLVFTIAGLWRMSSSSMLWKTLVKQGVIYFIINIVVNIILLALNRVNMNPIMNAIFAMPVACICTIASSQVVLSLLRPSPNHESDAAAPVKPPPLATEVTVLRFATVAEA
ncbi:hypothetical protein DFH29DRAFT_964029 [Suillus ampliporus]|nr:hypothetical protein DFH29DRAFT_964029 [Suillus ampliporus]